MDNGTVKTSDPDKAEDLAKKGVNVKLVDKVDEKKKRPDYADVDGDGDKKEPMAKAFKDKKKSQNEGVMSELDILTQEASSVEEFLENVFNEHPQHRDNPEIIEYLEDFYDEVQNRVDEGKLKKVLGGAALLATLLGINKVTSEKMYNGDPKIKSLTTQYEKAKEEGNKEAMAKFEKEIENRKTQWDTGKVNETKTVELPVDTTFTLDLKHLMKKHLDEGKSQEDVIKLTKALMKKLHDKGEVTVNGTKVIFKEGKKKKSGYMGYTELAETFTQNYLVYYQLGSWGVGKSEIIPANSAEEAINIVTRKVKSMGDTITRGVMGNPVITAKPMSTNKQENAQLTLPEPPARNYLGDDGMDYEGGMAKSQLLKMKKYAMALCDMVEDETQLEAWVQAKITKASDYMSAVFHYLDYQNSKMDEAYIDPEGNLQDFESEGTMEIDDFIQAFENSSTIQEFSEYFNNPQAVSSETIDFILNSNIASEIPQGASEDRVWDDFRWLATPRTLQQLYMTLRKYLQ